MVENNRGLPFMVCNKVGESIAPIEIRSHGGLPV